MCKQLKGILWPLNLLGKKMRSVTVDIPSGLSNVSLSFYCTAERAVVSYTRRKRIANVPQQIFKTEIMPVKITYDDPDRADEQIISISRGQSGGGTVVQDTPENQVHFTLTNCTYLEVNGTVYIND